jgi:AmmeMemoRadiSam system protein A
MMTCSLTPLDRRALLSAARQAIAAHLVNAPRPALTPARPLSEAVAGVFVTLRRADELRGCIGDPTGGPLVETVMHCAVAAASSDPRFEAVTLVELPTIEIEISVLGPIEAIPDPLAFEVGRHGLIVERGRRRGLLLPQVAVEWGWERDTFLAHTCQKAGLPADAWRHGAQILRFEAEVFGELESSAEA